MNKHIHCKTPVKSGQKNSTYWFLCERCGKAGKSNTEQGAWKAFQDSQPDPGKVKTDSAPVNRQFNPQTAIIPFPKNPNQIPQWAAQNATALIELASPVVSDKPAMQMMIKRNLRYVQNNKNLDRCWQTPAGQESIVHAMEDAMCLGATLGEMGDIVPYGEIAEFIPAVEAYEFALTNGKNAPFKWLKIEAIYENDSVSIGRKGGDFFIDFERMGNPRGSVVQVAVYGEHRDGQILGELYDAERLLGKAKEHSSSYRYYLQDKRTAEIYRQEGKLKTKNGREYFVKDLPNGKTRWIFLDELSNPYEGADQPEMLRKAAGKSFLRKYARVRNAEAAMGEMSEDMTDDDIESVVDRAFSMADEAMPDVESVPVDVPDDVQVEIVDDSEDGEDAADSADNGPIQNELQIDD